MRKKDAIINCSLVGLFFLLAMPIGEAQILKGRENKDASAEHIVNLRNGTLVVRLVSKHNNISALDEQLAAEGVGENQKKQLRNRRDNMLEKQTKANKEIVKSLDRHYSFSDYRVLYDTAMVYLLDGKTEGYFLNSKMEIDPKISINSNAPFYILSVGQTSTSETHNLEGLIVSDRANVDLVKPFPYFTKSIYPPVSFFDAFIGRSASIFPDFKKMIVRLNKKLTIYHKDVEYKSKNQSLKEEMRELKEKLKEEETEMEEH